jgi:protoheme IX farnesyltransferase
MHPYLELSKARLTLLVLCTTAVGFAVAARGRFDAVLFFWTLLGTGLAASGANALNQWWEARPDSLMERTRIRPIPAHRLTRRHALLVASGSGFAGVAILAWRVNLLTAALGAFVILLYVLAYTPLKRRTPFCTLVGAVCGAIPPMMGWTGFTGQIGFGAWILALTLFLWQIPHFLALAWLYREDYARGGFRMLPSVDPTGRLTGILASVYSAALLPLGSLFFLSGIAGWTFLLGSVALGAALFALGLRLFRTRDRGVARNLFLGSIAYLPLLLLLLLLDPGPQRTSAESTPPPDPTAKSAQTMRLGRRGSTEPLTQLSNDYRDTNTFSLLTSESASSRKK